MTSRQELHNLIEVIPDAALEHAKELLSPLCAQPKKSPPGGAPPRRRPIERLAAELAARVPAEEWDSLPEDLTDNLDHYIYGTPKQ